MYRGSVNYLIRVVVTRGQYSPRNRLRLWTRLDLHYSEFDSSLPELSLFTEFCNSFNLPLMCPVGSLWPSGQLRVQQPVFKTTKYLYFSTLKWHDVTVLLPYLTHFPRGISVTSQTGQPSQGNSLSKENVLFWNWESTLTFLVWKPFRYFVLNIDSHC